MDEERKGYAWEEEYKRSWDVLLEEDQVQGIVSSMMQQLLLKRKKVQDKPLQRGMIRHTFIVLDLSKAMSETDLRPSRLEFCMNSLKTFISDYFEQNPLSHLGLIVSMDGLAELWSDLCGNPADVLNSLKKVETVGEPSLQNALELAHKSLAGLPKHVSKEMIVILGSLTTKDPGNIYDTIDTLQASQIRVSCLGLAAEMHICKTLTSKTKGVYTVIMNEGHFNDTLMDFIHPPPLVEPVSSCLLMGFPKSTTFETTLCAW